MNGRAKRGIDQVQKDVLPSLFKVTKDFEHIDNLRFFYPL